ncbi:exopolyphosphatase [Shewanella yunxiaonensis]|uniref:Exopolyphosphatase n=1 Tax=Shewanella yunxiaonensis TaxID=2829809 RepID=A0ABX7YZ36_9GAMM|nr:exopolyphosphatase [Shewanella yunxiaonensis]QUN07565.1 exopolyphosphatase [Shewanella yunxiaonensis]
MGSNSFHLVIAREQDGSIQILHKEKQLVQLADGLDNDNVLSDAAITRGIACLQEFKQRFSSLPIPQVRMVATYTLRVAKNRDAFLQAAQQVLPYPIEVVSGHEEARLIYSGIAHTQVLAARNLIIDIGGGSTEVVVGSRTRASSLSSLRCGCVSYNQRFFKDGVISAAAFNAALSAADKQFASLSKEYFTGNWDLTLGSSGSVKAICEALLQFFGDDTVTMARLKQLKQKLIAWGHINKIQLDNVDSKRTPLLPAGLAILISFFRRLPVISLEFANGALREGVLYELAGIGTYSDVRQRTVDSLAQLYHIDHQHAEKVRNTAITLFNGVAESWGLQNHRHTLEYAAILHETGIHISSRAHHKHGAYIIANSDMPGFGEQQQQLLARLIGNQRKKLDLERLTLLEPSEKLLSIRLISLLRLAVLLNLGRIASSVHISNVSCTERGLTLALKEPKHRISLFVKDLQREQKQMANVNFELKFSFA